MPNTQRNQVDKDWFHRRLQDGKKSVRGLARHLELDPSAVSRMLSGQRKMGIDEATAIARFIGEPVNEVLSHAGVSDGTGVSMSTSIMLSATIDESGNISSLEEPTILPQDVVDRAYAAISHQRRDKVFAAQVRSETGPLAALDDAVMFYIATEIIEPAAIGTLSVCETADGRTLLAKVEKARKTGEATLRFASDDTVEVVLKSATPVVAIIP